MKMRHLVVATSAALVSLGAIAGGQQPQSQESGNRTPQAATESSVISEAQGALRSHGYAATPQGLREFQQAKGIEPSGKLDEETLAALGVGVSASSGASSESAAQPAETRKN